MRKKNVIVVMLILLAVMAIGYGAFSTTLTINGTANISSSWEVVFTEINQLSKTDGVTITTAPQASGTTATFDVDLTSPGDAIEYQIKVENKGSIDAKIESITATETGSDAIVFEISDIKEGQTLLKQATKTFKVKISYKDSITSQPNITTNKLMVSINFVQLVGSSTEGEAPTLVTEKLAARILKDNIAYADNVRSPYVASDNGIDFSQVSSSTNGQGLYYTNKDTDGGKPTYYFRGDVDNNYVALGGDTYDLKGVCIANDVWYENYWNSTDRIDYELRQFSDVKTQAECEAITDACSFNLPHYLDRGSSCDEWANEFGESNVVDVETKWYTIRPTFRIVRINEDGSVRLMSTEWIMESTIDGFDNRDVQVYRAEYKEKLQTWYDENQLSKFSSNLISNNFCYDDSIAFTEDCIEAGACSSYEGELNYYYGAYDRLITNKSPKFSCSVEKDGGYVDLINMDEVAYAGGVYGQSIGGYLSDFLYDYGMWDIGTPSSKGYFSDISYTMWFHINSSGNFLDLPYKMLDTSRVFYPVINVKGDIKVISGNGTSDSPYVLQMN